MAETPASSVTVKGIPLAAKENFSLFCTMQNKTMQEVLRDFICSVYAPNPQEKQFMIFQVVNNLSQKNPDLIDKFILKQEPFFGNLSDWQRNAARINFVAMNPSYIYNEFNKWLESETAHND
ncbi:MAG: hypothetical protein LBI94_02120 [Treponema sp.]|nr:hypothetical protein [Treponema sp.]